MAEIDDKKYYICRDIKFRYILNLFITERLFKGNKIAIYYLNPNRVSIFLEKLSKLLTRGQNRNISFLHRNYDIWKMKNEKGIPVVKASGCDDLNEIINKIDKIELGEGRSVFDCLNEKLSHLREDLRLYIKQQIALESFNDLVMANVAYWLFTNRGSELYGKNLVLLMEKKSYWSYLIFDYLKSRNVNFKLFRQLNFKKNKGILFAYHLIKLFVELVMSLAAGQISKEKEPSEKAKIGIPFYVHRNFTDFLDKKNYYLFWFYKSGINPEDILIYVPEAKFKFSAEEVSNIKKAGFNITYCPTRITRKGNNNVPTYLCSFNTVLLLIQYLKQILAIFVSIRNKSMLEQWKILSVLFIQLPYWEDFFTKNNIKIKFRFHDMFSIRDIAAKLSGAIILSYHYSNHSDARITREEVCDSFFIWGELYRKVLSPVHSTCRHLIKTGYVFDNAFNDNLKERAAGLRDRFKACGVSYIIGIFSENLMVYLGKAQMDFYEKILKYIASHQDMGIIIKPKKENDNKYLRISEETGELIGILEKEGRIEMMDSRKYPAEAGYASDIVIGVIPDSTAGLECALAGIPMVIYDCSNRKESHSLYKIGHNKIIFDDIQYLLNTIDENRAKPGGIRGIPGFADWSFILNEVDPFRDGKANQRVAYYIKTLLQKSSNGSSKNEVIEAANRAYAEEYDRDKVISLHGEISNIKHGKQRTAG